jgi:hypothetical protein
VPANFYREVPANFRMAKVTANETTKCSMQFSIADPSDTHAVSPTSKPSSLKARMDDVVRVPSALLITRGVLSKTARQLLVVPKSIPMTLPIEIGSPLVESTFIWKIGDVTHRLPQGLRPRQVHRRLQQGFATDEMGFGGQFARQQF